MKQTRLAWLLAVMSVLILLRWLVPPRSEVADDVVVAVTRPERHAVVATGPQATQAQHIPPTEARDVAGNAFAVRVVRQPPAPPPPPVIKVKAFVGPPEPPPPAPPPPPPPPPPLQIVGTWDDGAAPGVFVATGQGTVLARPGSVLLAEYRVTAITAQYMSITHAVTKHVWQIPVPRATANR